MSRLRFPLVSLLALVAALPAIAEKSSAPAAKVTSPNGQITLLLFAAQPGAAKDSDAVGLRYAVEFHGKRLLEESKLGLELAGAPELGDGMQLTGAETSSVDQSYTIPVGKTSTVRDHYNAVRASFQDAAGRKVVIEARAFDDGVAFRYAVPEQPALHEVQIVARADGVQLRAGHDLVPADSRRLPVVVGGRVPAPPGERASSGLDHRPAVPYRGAGQGLGGHHRGQHRQLRRHVPAQGQGGHDHARRSFAAR